MTEAEGPTTREYHCEVCGRKDELTEAEAYESGWDYPPFIGKWGVISPRTCPNCLMMDTAWWWIVQHGTDDLPPKHMDTIRRIVEETETIPEYTDGGQ